MVSISPAEAYNASRVISARRRGGGANLMPRRVPDPPGTGSLMRFFHEVQWVTSLFADQCQVDPWLLVETASLAALRAFWTVLEPDPKEFYHQVVGQSVVCTLKQDIREAAEFKDAYNNGLGKWLFRTSEVVDLAVWKLFIASVIADGLADWQTMAQQMEGCADQKLPWSSHTAFGAIPDADQHYPGNGFDWVLNDPNYPVMAAVTQVHPGQKGYLVWCCQAKNSQGDEVPILKYIERGSDGAQLEIETSEPKPHGGYHPIVSHFHTLNTGATSESYTLRAHAIVPCPNGEAFFLKGYCASSNPFGF